MGHQFEKSVTINSSFTTVWNTLTDLDLVKQWMGEKEMDLEIITTWEINSPITVRGFHHVKFENRGIVLKYQPNKLLEYTHLSSLSRLEHKPSSYSTFQFELTPVQYCTVLKFTMENFPTETIYRHLCFYWRTTIEKIKNFAEQQVELVK